MRRNWRPRTEEEHTISKPSFRPPHIHTLKKGNEMAIQSEVRIAAFLLKFQPLLSISSIHLTKGEKRKRPHVTERAPFSTTRSG
jgi:hypothetical protein